MYIKENIAYAENQTPLIKISGVKPMDDYKLWLRFNTGETKIFDFKPLLSEPAFSKLLEKDIFNSVYIDYGITVWGDGEIDISPSYLYEHSNSTSNSSMSFN